MISVDSLSKSYGKHSVLNNLTFTVPDGQVTGFLGPNGSGKSTTMRCMLGLDRPSRGHINFSGTYNDGRAYSGSFASLNHKAHVAGAVLDASWFNPKRSGRAHLKILADYAGVPGVRVDECLDLVGLSTAAKRKAGGYSLGMKQRLGLAAALLGNPQHLIMDEPVNGLDPEGVSWMRKIIRHLASEGRCVLVSSHLLSEMQLTADRIVVIGRGAMIGEYSMQEFLAGGQKIIVRFADPATVPPAFFDSLHHNGLHATAQSSGKFHIEPVQKAQQGAEQGIQQGAEYDEAEARYRIARLAAENNILITELFTESDSLEQRFLAATSGTQEYTMGAIK